MILVGNVKLTNDGKFEPCTWNIIDGDVAQENTLLAGKVVNLLNAPFPVNSTIKYYKDQNDFSVGLIKEGAASISEISPACTASHTISPQTPARKSPEDMWAG